MVCPRCRNFVSSSAGHCSVCGAGVALGVLTPPSRPPVNLGKADAVAGAHPPQATADPAGTSPSESPTIPRLERSSETNIAAATEYAGPAGSAAFTHGAGGFSTDSGPLTIGQRFGSRYHIKRLLGAGGMGAVYEAWDEELEITVAIKVVRSEVTADPASAADVARRFKRELVLGRQVTHKNVVRIHDLGEIDGIKYITMSYVEGKDLATVLRTHGRLPIDKTLRFARSVVSGLVAAHAAGVVHRDLKPGNIMIDADDEALIMDFGIARSTGVPVGGKVPGATTIVGQLELAASQPDSTVLGTVVGTLEYMAPEQARGVSVDQRADVYAVGLIMYDMLVGRSRLSTGNAMAELRARMAHTPPPVKSFVPDVPEALNQLIGRCLEPDPARRFQTSAELGQALDRLDERGAKIPIRRALGLRAVATLIALAMASLGASLYLARKPVAPLEHEQVSVLIADFENGTHDRAFERSLEQAFTTALESAPFITASNRDEARKVVTRLNGTEALDQDAARVVSTREGIKVVLAGSIVPKNSGYAITVKALDPTNGQLLGTAAASARDKGEVLKALGSVAARTRAILGDASPESGKASAAETVTAASLEALAEYSRGQERLFNLQHEEAIAHYKRAIEHDPSFGRAYANWATAAGNLGRRDEAAELWKKALSLTDRMTEREKYRTFGGYYLAMTQNYDKAIESFSALVKQYPYDSVGHVNLALAYFYNRNFDKALEEGRRSIEVDPRSLINHNNYALYAMYSGDFKTAADEARKNIATDPTYFRSYLPSAVAAVVASDFAAASAAYAQMAKGDPQAASVASIGLADLAIYQGRFADAIALLQQRLVTDRRNRDIAYTATNHLVLAEAYEQIGEPALAVDSARTALKIGARHESVVVPAARVLLRLGNGSEAAGVAAELGQRFEAHSRAYATMLSAELAARRQRSVDAISGFRDALKLTDLWLARFDLGVAYVQAGHHAEALSELERCVAKRGEASAIFLDDVPTVRYQATLTYWLGRANEGVGSAQAAAQNYKAYLQIRSAAARDPLAADARRRLQNLPAS